MIRTFALAIALAYGSAAASSQTSNNWEIVGVPGISDGIVLCCDLAVDGHNVVHVAYQDLNQPFAQASVQRFAGSGWQYDGAKGGGSVGRAWYNQIGFDGHDNLYLACRDYGSNGKLNVRLFLRATNNWINVGPSGSSPDEAHYTSLKVGSDGVPVTVFADRSTTPIDKATVLRYDFASGSWKALGGYGLSTNTTLYDCVALNHNNVPYVAYSDNSFPDNSGIGKATVKRYEPATDTWRFVGSPGFTSSGGLNLWMEFDYDNVPYIVYQLYHTTFLVLRWSGTSWTQLGGSATGTDLPDLETEPWRQWISLRFDSQNTPDVAYQLLNNGFKAAVRKFDGSNWVPVGNVGFSAGQADYLALAIDKDDVPWVAFRDGAVGQRLTVMRYKPTSYTYCTSTTSSAGCVAEIRLHGTPSATSPAPCPIIALPVINNRIGILIYGFTPDQIPFGSGTLCIRPPIKRTPAQGSGGSATGTNCTGAFSYDFNALIQSGADANLALGRGVFAQYWYRDPQGSGGTALSNALRLFIGP